MKKKEKDKYQCGLLPFTRKEFVSIQDISQKIGWEITAFNLPKTWEKTQGEGVVVAVLDSGCDLDHSDLKDNLLPGKNFVDLKKDPIDDLGHGTHVTGIICARNNDIGVVGVAPKCKVVPVKVLDKKGSGNLINVAEGIRWSADQGVDFITMSLGSPTPIQQVRKAIQYANSKGVIVFCAAGNAGKTREIFYPANYPETIGVGAIDENFNRAEFSCTGDDLDFLAPGVEIFSTVPDNWYAFLSGTSMANPFVVGVCALLLSYKRQHGLKFPLKTTDDYKNILRQNTVKTKDPKFAGKKFFEGFGIIDPAKMEDWIKLNG